ncbi:TPA: LPD29 domain-containing protein [Burkholderia lata]
MATTQQTRTTNANRAFPAPQAPQTASIHSKTTPEALNTVLDLTSTAQLVLDIMAEAFPGVPVFVKTRQADDQTRIHVEWTDGPTEQQVKKLLLPLQSSTPGQWGGTTPVEHFRLTARGPQRVQLTADRITVRRRFSDGLVTSVLQRLAHRHVGRLDPETLKLLTVDSFKKGALLGVLLYGVHFADAGNSLHTDVETALHAHTDVQGYPRSATAAGLFVRKPLKA